MDVELCYHHCFRFSRLGRARVDNNSYYYYHQLLITLSLRLYKMNGGCYGYIGSDFPGVAISLYHYYNYSYMDAFININKIIYNLLYKKPCAMIINK